ncbi:hypothetical protein [Pseudoxanthomonas mexicana]
MPLNLGVEWSDEPPIEPEPPFSGLRATTGIPWARAPRTSRVSSLGWRDAPQLQVGVSMAWGQAAAVRRGIDLAWGAAARVTGLWDVGWQTSLPPVRMGVDVGWQALGRITATTAVRWQSLGGVRAGNEVRWLHPGQTSRTWSLPFRGQLPQARRSVDLTWQHPLAIRRAWRIPWGIAARVPWLVLPPLPPEPPEEPETPFPSGDRVGLNLGCALLELPGFVPLNLGVHACYAVRPQRRTYIVRNSLTVVRLPDRLPIEVDSISITGNTGAWGATVDMTLSRPSDLQHLKPNVSGPRAIEVTINGYVWTFIVESYGRRRQVDNDGAPAGSVSVEGRSRTALLAAPYAPARTKATSEERSVAQLVDEELASTGYTAVYDTVDWLVPEGAWYYDGLTPLEAISRLAEAGGAVVQSDPEDLVLRVVARYPASPWTWTVTAPDHVIQDDIVTADSLQQRPAPLYDAVVVTGEIAGKGVTATVKRAGEAGTLYAPQASSPLINVAAAAGERGRNILSDRGQQANFDLTLPLFPAPLGPGETGRVLPQQLVRVEEAAETWHGQCTSYRVDARLEGQPPALVVEQTVTLERHFSDAD